MTAVQITSLPESAFALPSSYYASVEVTPVPGPPEPTDWSLVDWYDGDTLLGFEYGHAEVLGAVPAKDLGR